MVNNHPCAYCALCEYGNKIEIEDLPDEFKNIQFVTCKYLIEKDIQVAFDSCNNYPCARFKINSIMLGFLREVDRVTYDGVEWILDEIGMIEDHPIMLQLYPLPQSARRDSDHRKKIGLFITRHFTKEKWIVEEDSDGIEKFMIPVPINDEVPIKTELFEPVYKRVKILTSNTD